MKQVLRRGLEDIVVVEVPDPPLTRGHVLIRPFYSLISSGTETASLHRDGLLREVADHPSHLQKVWAASQQNGPLRTADEVRAKFREYAALGYAGAGVVVARGDGIQDLDPGQRVAYGGEGTGHAETIAAPRNLVARLPDGVSLRDASFTTLGSIALNAVRTAAPSLGETVVVLGLGLVGQLVAQLARLHGAVVIGVDLRRDRLELARRLGADHALESEASLIHAVGALTDGRGADSVIIAAASKSAAPARQALAVCRDRGRIVVVGAVAIDLPWHEMYMKEIQLFMSRAYGPGSYDPQYEREGHDYPIGYVRWTEARNMEEFLRLLETGAIQTAPLVTHELALDHAPRGYDAIMDRASGSLAVVLRYPAAEPAGGVDALGGGTVTTDGAATANAAGGEADAAARAVSAFAPRRTVAVAAATPASSTERGRALRFALVGAGNLARWAHLPALRRIEGATLRAVCSSSGARGRTYAERFGGVYTTSDYDAVLNDDAVDAVLIVSRNDRHFGEAERALRAGKHVFVEKPMAVTESESLALLRLAESTGLVVGVGFNRRFAPFYLEQKRRIAARTTPAVLDCRVNSPGISGSYWMADPSIGGAIVGEAVHFVDLMAWLLDAEPVDVAAYTLPTGGEPIGENNLAGCIRFGDGSVATLAYSTVGSRSSAGERVEAFTQGVAVVVEDFKRLEVRTTRRRRRRRLWPAKGYDAQLRAFVDALRGGAAADLADARDGARATVTCLRLLESARIGRTLPVGLDLTGTAAGGPSASGADTGSVNRDAADRMAASLNSDVVNSR